MLKKTVCLSKKAHHQELTNWYNSNKHLAAFHQEQEVDHPFISYEEAGIEESSSCPVFGGFVGDNKVEHLSGGIFEYTYWLMDGEINLEY